MKYVDFEASGDANVSSRSYEPLDVDGLSLLARDQRILGTVGVWFLRTAAVASVIVVGGLMTLVGARIWRVENSRQALSALGAETRWLHESAVPAAVPQATTVGSMFAKLLGNATVSELGTVKITTGDPSDEALACIGSLKGVRRLELSSDRATDATLATIARLPNLRHLAASGKNFSIKGLLQLRSASKLQRLVIAADQYSSIELAVLRAALREVKIRQFNQEDRLDLPAYSERKEVPLLASSPGVEFAGTHVDSQIAGG
jgi:hypothetical protein